MVSVAIAGAGSADRVSGWERGVVGEVGVRGAALPDWRGGAGGGGGAGSPKPGGRIDVGRSCASAGSASTTSAAAARSLVRCRFTSDVDLDRLDRAHLGIVRKEKHQPD